MENVKRLVKDSTINVVLFEPVNVDCIYPSRENVGILFFLIYIFIINDE